MIVRILLAEKMLSYWKKQPIWQKKVFRFWIMNEKNLMMESSCDFFCVYLWCCLTSCLNLIYALEESWTGVYALHGWCVYDWVEFGQVFKTAAAAAALGKARRLQNSSEPRAAARETTLKSGLAMLWWTWLLYYYWCRSPCFGSAHQPIG